MLLAHVMLHSSLVPRPFLLATPVSLLIWIVCLSCLQFSRGAEEEGTFSEFDEGTRNLQLLWTNIQPSSKTVSLVPSDNVVIHEPGHDEK